MTQLTNTILLRGGLNVVTPAIAVPPMIVPIIFSGKFSRMMTA